MRKPNPTRPNNRPIDPIGLPTHKANQPNRRINSSLRAEEKSRVGERERREEGRKDEEAGGNIVRSKKQEGNNAYLHLWTLSRPTALSLTYGVVTDGRMDGLEMEKKEIERTILREKKVESVPKPRQFTDNDKRNRASRVEYRRG